ncbi:hypothetical protein DERF_014979 [Dermatophagoides farinae]|uniref:Uncharacterized protein n=1 Tax=Dermatophagoides farinae TaxID=6954 RepID=A0A922HQB9_DERFA|nr:hypothetical protein DERF_014979 [Dermatophagoides farinae]
MLLPFSPKKNNNNNNNHNQHWNFLSVPVFIHFQGEIKKFFLLLIFFSRKKIVFFLFLFVFDIFQLKF